MARRVSVRAVDEADDRRPRRAHRAAASPGDKRDPRRAPPRRLLPVHRPGPAHAPRPPPAPRRRPPAVARAGSRASLLGPPARQRGGDRRAAVEEEGARDLQLGRDLVVRLRDRGDHPRVHPRAASAARAFTLPESASRSRVLLAIVAFSYRQVCIAYPTGGGSYSVSKANLGRLASLVAASALLIDYTLTVAVSTSSAVEQIVSAVPALDDVRGGDRGRRDPADHDRQPARPARGRQHLRDPDLPVPRQRVPR